MYGFRKEVGSKWHYIEKYYAMNGVWKGVDNYPEPEASSLRSHWASPNITYHINKTFTHEAFFRQILRRLNDQDIESSFIEASQQQIDDIILCYAANSIFRDFLQSSKFVDMNKAQVFIAFESGLYCSYPNHLQFTASIYNPC